LRGFDPAVFKKAHDPELLGEDDRLQALNQLTVVWAEKMFIEGR
jgi:hypothetical protein